MCTDRRNFLRLSAGIAGATLLGSESLFAASEVETAQQREVPEAIRKLKRMTEGVAPITLEERRGRIEKARRLMREKRIDAIYLEPGTSMSYFTGMRWGTSERMFALVIPVRGEVAWICPKFEEERARELIKIGDDIRTWEEDESPFALVASTLRDSGVNVVAIDPALPFDMASRLSAEISTLRLQDASSIVNGCRMYKSAAELALMQYAKNLTLEVHRRAARILAPGISTKEVRRFIDDAHRALGTSGNTFCIVHFAEATAYPHGLPGEQQLRENDIVLIVLN